MKLKSRIKSLCFAVAASIILVILGCGGGGGGGGSDVPIVPVPTDADLSLTKTVDNSTPDVDDTVVFTLTISNSGPAAATGVVLTDILPTGFTYVSDSSGGAYNPVTGLWSPGSIAAGVSLTLNITATVNASGNYVNLAEVTASNDPNPNNNGDGVSAPPPSINISINQIQTDCTTNEITAFATVVDQLGNPLTTLGKSNFTVTENQLQLNPADFDVQYVNAIPLSVSIVLDYSTSIRDSGADTAMEQSAVEFIDQLYSNDSAEIIKFGTTVNVVQGFTNDKTLLKQAVLSPFAFQPETEIYQAILRGLEDTATQTADKRKAVVIITDGRQNPDPSPSGVTIDDCIASAKEKDIPIFTIGLGVDIDTEDLGRLASETGGIFYQSISVDDIPGIYDQLAEALIINQFIFTYTSTLTGAVPADLTIGVVNNGLTDSDTRAFTSCP
jgi:VWFA-related protein